MTNRSPSEAYEEGEVKEKGAADVVCDLGYGLAQLRWMILAYMCWGTAAIVIAVGPVFTVFLATKLNFNQTQKAALATFAYSGLTLGSFFGGVLGDKMGRRPPIVMAYLLTGLLVLVTSRVSPSYAVLACAQLLSGCVMGLGFPTSVAIVSETTPKPYRMFVQALRNMFYNLGLVSGNVIFVFDDPYYQDLHWRLILALISIPALVMFALSWLLLRESPTFLANIGDHSGATEILVEMKRLNRKQNVSISYAQEVPASALEPAPSEQLSWTDRCKVIFGQRHCGTTVALLLNSFTLSLALYGHMYAFPLIATDGSASSAMAPAWQSLMQTLIGIGVIVISLVLTIFMSRRSLLVLAWVIGIAGTSLFAWSGKIQNRNPFQETMYLVSQNLPGSCTIFGFTVVYQLAVDAYPINVASTAAGIVMMSGKVGCMLSPFVFELSGDVDHFWNFYMLLAAMGMLSLTLALCIMNFIPHEEHVAAQPGEETPLLSSRATHK